MKNIDLYEKLDDMAKQNNFMASNKWVAEFPNGEVLTLYASGNFLFYYEGFDNYGDIVKCSVFDVFNLSWLMGLELKHIDKYGNIIEKY